MADSKKLVIDIETSGVDFDTLNDSQQEYLLREAQKEKTEEARSAKQEEIKGWTSLWPFTAQVVVIGLYDPQLGKAFVYYNTPVPEEFTNDETGDVYKGMPEKDMLEKFWAGVTKYNQIITFNGRGFDIPFLMLRSAMLGVKPSKNFMGNRFSTTDHVDLLETLSFYGAYKRFNLDFYCQGFGITSPKAEGVTGHDVKRLFDEGEIMTVAEYCARDIKATYELYKFYDQFLK